MTRKNCYIKGSVLIGSLLFLLVAATMIADRAGLDLLVSGLFYSKNTGWFLKESQPWYAIYRYGTIPGLALAILSLVAWFFCLFSHRFFHLHRYFLLVVLTAVIGAGLFVNVILKPYWGRPRPSQVKEFAGLYDYRCACDPGTPGKGESFPCGHCTMGYLFVSLFFFRRVSRATAYAGGSIGLIYGGLVSTARIVQGAHFLTDTLWSLGIIWMTAAFLYYFILKIPVEENLSRVPASKNKMIATGIIVTLFIMLMVTFFLTRRPYYETSRFGFKLRPGTEKIIIRCDFDLKSWDLEFTDVPELRLIFHSEGFGWPSSEATLTVNHRYAKGLAEFRASVASKGYFSELGYSLLIRAPEALSGRLGVMVGDALNF